MKEETTVDSAQRGLRLKPANCNAENQRFTKPTKTHKHAPQYAQQSSRFITVNICSVAAGMSANSY